MNKKQMNEIAEKIKSLGGMNVVVSSMAECIEFKGQPSSDLIMYLISLGLTLEKADGRWTLWTEK